MMKRLQFLILLGLVFTLGACATPKVGVYNPKFHAKAPSDLSVAVTDHRPLVMSKKKEAWFEGVVHKRFMIPEAFKREGLSQDKTFALYLSDRIKASFETGGINPEVVELPDGASLQDAISQVSRLNKPGIIVTMKQSIYKFVMIDGEYRYDFLVTVMDSSGKEVISKSFANFEIDIPVEHKFGIFNLEYNVMETFGLKYREVWQKILSDPEIESAIENL